MSTDTARASDMQIAALTHAVCEHKAKPNISSTELSSSDEITIGRMRLSCVIEEQKRCDDGRMLTVVQARIRTTSKQSSVGRDVFIGAGNDLASAVGTLLHEIAAQSFSISSISTEHNDNLYSARVFLQDEEKLGTLYFGVASSRDNTTAILAATIRALSNGGLLKGKYLCAGHKEAIARAERLVELTCSGIGACRSERRAELLHSFLLEINEFAAGVSMIAAKNSASSTVLSRFDVTTPHRYPDNTTTATKQALWHEWNPGLENDGLTLREVVASMPACAACDIPAIVRFFENPASPCKMRGAISLVDHDHLHVVLGRGLQDQDEAFVLGFTMGTEKNLTRIEQFVFKLIISRLYPQPYRIAPHLLRAYELGVRAGEVMGLRKINRIDMSQYLDMRLGDIRRELGIDIQKLREFYSEEAKLIPGTMVSERLSK